jgi:hypothetical protein
MSGKPPVIYRPPNSKLNDYYRKVAEDIKKRQTSPSHIGFPSKGGRRMTKRKSMKRRKTQRRKHY